MYSKPSKISQMELLEKIDSSVKSLIIFAKIFILDIWKGSKYATESSKATMKTICNQFRIKVFTYLIKNAAKKRKVTGKQMYHNICKP